jgi:hypothetical protein
MKKLFSSVALIALFALIAFADVRLPDTPTPKQSKKIDTRLRISISKDAKEARLRIPKSQIQMLRAELDELDGGESTATAATTFSFSRTQTIVSGLFLSLAFVAGGVWLARSRGGGDRSETKTAKTLIAGAGLFLTGAMATIAFANVGPPPEARSLTGKIFSNSVHVYKQASGKIKLETADETYGDIELIVPEAAKSQD